MKKRIGLLCLLCLLLGLCTVIFASAEETASVNALYFLDLVSGYDDEGKNFGLADSLTRAQAVVLIERYLGVGEEAAACTEETPLTDVPDWAKNYVAYAYTHDLVKGVSEKMFAPDTPISETQFLTLLLRAMEYSDAAGDFVWSEATGFAKKLGLTDREDGRTDYLRGSAFETCFTALGTKTKGGKTVAEKLIGAGVITEKAYGYAGRIAAGEKLTVACVGDSLTQGTGSSNASKYSYPAVLQKLLGQGFKVVNCGKASSYVMNVETPLNVKAGTPDLWYPRTAVYQTLLKSKPDIVIVLLGCNDARSMVDPSAEDIFVKDYNDLLDVIEGFDKKPEIYLANLLHTPNADVVYQGTATLSKLIRSIGEERKLPVLELGDATNDYYFVMLPYNDSVHPTDATYPMMADFFYNEVFGHSIPLPELPKAQDGVVYLSGYGSRNNDGLTPQTAVDTLGMAVAMLRENGGTVVVSGPTTVKETHLVSCGGPVTVTSVYDGVDYAETKKAQLTFNGNLALGSAVKFENIHIHSGANDKGIHAGYNDLTLGEGITCTMASGMSPLKINFGYRLAAATPTEEDCSCHKDCTLTVESGTWQIFRGGNMRPAKYVPMGTVDEDVTVSIYLRGGEFIYNGASTVTGQNGCAGHYYFEMTGGKIVGSLYAVANSGVPQFHNPATFFGDITVKITGGEIGGQFGLYQSTACPKAAHAKLILSDEMSYLGSDSGFSDIDYVK